MTQGEILSAFAPLHELWDIYISIRRDAILTTNDVNMIMPFVKAAQDAVEKLSRFALDHFNSPDENKRELSKIIYDRRKNGHTRFVGCCFKGVSPSVDSLNFSIKNIDHHISNTIYSYESYIETLPSPKSDDEENADKGVAIGGATDGVTIEHFGEKKEEIGEECLIDKNSKKTVEEWDNQFDDVFDPMLDSQEIFKVLEKKSDPRVTDDYPRFFVFFRVLLYIGWIKNHQKNFLKWANCHWKLNWTKDYNFKFGNNIQKELRDTDMDKWDDKTCNGSDIGKAYRNLAIKVMSALTEKVNDGMLIDRSGFYREGVADRINDGKKMRYPF